MTFVNRQEGQKFARISKTEKKKAIEREKQRLRQQRQRKRPKS